MRWLTADNGLARAAWVVVLLFTTARASAQITLDQFVPAPTQRDGFVVPRPDHPGRLRLGGQLVFDYAKEPLVLHTQGSDGSSTSQAVVKDQLAGHALFSVGLFDRALLFLHLPMSLVMAGDSAAGLQADGTKLGNVAIGGRIACVGDPEGRYALGIQASLSLPTSAWLGRDSSFSGEKSVTGHVRVLNELRTERFRVSTTVGARLLQAKVEFLHLDPLLTFGLGTAYGLTRGALDVDLVAEVYGTTPFSHFGRRESTPVEALFGPKAQHQSGVGFGLAGGAGVTHGYGAPAYRFIASLGYLQPATRDRDDDGVVDAADRCPSDPEDRDGFEDADGCPDLDNDHDGILDAQDQCPQSPEDPDGFEDADGCPDVDNDGDGIVDAIDHCPLAAEDVDGFEDADGCPDTDNDVDGIFDKDDACPLDAEDRDGFEDTDGCPDPDNDGDQIPDSDDECPLDAETFNGQEDEDGCPDKIRVNRTQGQIFTLDPVHFARNSATVLSSSFAMLEEIAVVLKSHPDIEVLAVEGHTDARGSDRRNLELSRRRAASVRAFLIKAGVSPERLTSEGFGESRPLADNDTKEGRAKNRRVEFRM